MESILPDLPPLPRRRITLPLSTLAEVARDVCDGYDPPAKGRPYAKAHPLWKWLTSEAPGILGSQAIKWNFTKFLVGRDGKVIKRYAPTDSPESMKKDIEAALAA